MTGVDLFLAMVAGQLTGGRARRRRGSSGGSQGWPRGSDMTLADAEGGKQALSTMNRNISSDAGSGYGGATLSICTG